ncbi:MAG: RluA family pseudouridine synthase [Planctomycetota bacterium]
MEKSADAAGASSSVAPCTHAPDDDLSADSELSGDAADSASAPNPAAPNPAAPNPAAPLALDIPAAAAGLRLDAWLAGKLPQFSRVQIKRLIDDGGARWTRPPKSGARIRAAYLIQGGEALVLTPPAPRPQAVAGEKIPLDILFEDADFVVVNKPAGLIVHPGAGVWSGTLANALVGRYGALPSAASETGAASETSAASETNAASDRPGIVHRLDKETSGVIVAARNETALRKLMAQFEARTVRKMYLALVHGAPPDEFEVEAPIGRHPTQRARMAICPPGEGRGSRTTFRTLARFGGVRAADGGLGDPTARASHSSGKHVGAPFALVACFPKTGRTHQLRVHLKSRDHPILADGLYGSEDRYPPPPAPALIDRQALHAFAIAFDHPTTGERLFFNAPVPADMAAVLDAWTAPSLLAAVGWRGMVAAAAGAFGAVGEGA